MRPPGEGVTDAETRQALVQLISELPPDFASVFVARVIDELPTASVATSGISEDLVRWRLRRARLLLRERIDADA